MAFIGDVQFALILMAVVGALVGSFVVFAATWLPWHAGAFYITETYQERDDKFYLAHKGRQPLSAVKWNLGKNFEFVIPSPAPVVFYENGRPVLHYLLEKTRPRNVVDSKGKPLRTKINPESLALVTPRGVAKGGAKPVKDELPDTESRSVNMIFRRGLIESIARGLNTSTLKGAIPLIILAAFASLMVGYVLFLSVHPGLVQSPPPGYYYKAIPIPTNSSGVVVH